MTNNSQNDTNDDQVLARLYKESAKETAPAKLNYEIINQAANAEKPSVVSSHFGGDWKVPLSLAASVVVVFGLIVQLDQSPEQLNLPPIPEFSAPTDSQQEKSDKTENVSSFSKESDFDIANDAPIEENTLNDDASLKEQEDRSSTTQIKPAAKKKAQPISSGLLESESDIKESADDMRNRSDTATESLMKQRSMQDEKSRLENNVDTTEAMASENEGSSSSALATESKQERESDFAPIPVEDWLLMIEKLIARKDYAEAARQLQKFKQAHPKVNVEDLESKIP